MKRSVAVVLVAVAFGGLARADLRTSRIMNASLVLDGAHAAILATAENLGYAPAADSTRKGPSVPRAITLEVGVEQPGTQRWVSAFLEGRATPASARIVFSDVNFRTREHFDLTDLSIAEVVLPKFDANNNKSAGRFKISALPTRVRWMIAPSTQVTGLGIKLPGWRPSDFRVTIPGVDASRVTSISEITVRKTRSGFEISPIEIVVNPGQTWVDWAQRVLVDGKPDRPIKILLELLAKDLKQVLANVEVSGVELVGMDHGGISNQRRFTFKATGVRYIKAITGEVKPVIQQLPPPTR